mmetsp:Transcript_25360/g.45032  ORF Transcript_25360/g.45032 Transcript_25360/m.45032 type:complete len:234 (+) Transcript_25360:795-1496(+)
MDAHLPTLLPVQLRQQLIDLPHGIILPAVVVAQYAENPDGLLVHQLLHLLRRDCKAGLRGDHELGLHVHVAKELLPGCLEAGRQHEVGHDPLHLLLRHPVALGIPAPPAELQTEACQQTCLSGPNCACPRKGAVLGEVSRPGAVPEMGHHVQHLIVHLEALRIDCLISQIDPGSEIHGLNFFVLKVDVDVRRGVQLLTRLQKVLILNHLQHVASGVAHGGHLVVVGGLMDSIC